MAFKMESSAGTIERQWRIKQARFLRVRKPFGFMMIIIMLVIASLFVCELYVVCGIIFTLYWLCAAGVGIWMHFLLKCPFCGHTVRDAKPHYCAECGVKLQ